MNLDNIQNGTVKSIDKLRKKSPSVTFIVERDVVAPVIFRNSSPDMSETQQFDGNLHSRVNSEKFVSRERLTGLKLLRNLSDKYGNDDEWDNFDFDGDIPDKLVSKEYSYNDPKNCNLSMNHDTLTYGIVGTGDQDYAIKSRVTEGYTYSLNKYDVSDSETRNAINETGTMLDEDNEQSTSLFNVTPIKIDNKFLHFVTVNAGTKGMVAYILHNLLNTDKYGARSTRTGRNINNKILGMIVSEYSVNLSTGEFMMNYDNSIDKVPDYINDAKSGDWNIYSDKFKEFDNMPSDYNELKKLAERQDEQKLYKLLKEDLHNNIKSISETYN